MVEPWFTVCRWILSMSWSRHGSAQMKNLYRTCTTVCVSLQSAPPCTNLSFILSLVWTAVILKWAWWEMYSLDGQEEGKLQNLTVFDCLICSLPWLFLPDSFCLSLQLEVLHSQTLMLIRERWGDLVQEERYVPAKYLTLSVWKYARLPRTNALRNECSQSCHLF